MIRAGILTIALLALPGTAAAYCGGGSAANFSVNCESGVQVIRHNARSSIPRGLSSAQAQLEVAKIRQETELKRIQAQRSAQAEQAELRRREIENERYRNRILESRNTCLLYTSPSPRDLSTSRMPSSA